MFGLGILAGLAIAIYLVVGIFIYLFTAGFPVAPSPLMVFVWPFYLAWIMFKNRREIQKMPEGIIVGILILVLIGLYVFITERKR